VNAHGGQDWLGAGIVVASVLLAVVLDYLVARAQLAWETRRNARAIRLGRGPALRRPGSAPGWLRTQMTASKVAAILGVSQWDSPRSMWHKMRNELPAEPRPRSSPGPLPRARVLAWWADEHGVDRGNGALWRNHPLYVMDGWAAATPDAEARVDGELVLVEAKSARDLDEWGTPGTDEIPTTYLFQCYWQMHVSGSTPATCRSSGPSSTSPSTS
jgi:hypothetical protein